MADKEPIQYICPNGTKRPFHYKNPYQLHNLKLLVASVNKDVEVVGVENRKMDYVRCFAQIKCVCGNILEIEKYLIGKKGRVLRCNECSLKSNREHCFKRTVDKQQERMDFLSDMGYEVLSDKKYFRNRDKILVRNKDGYIGYSTFGEIKKGKDILPFSAVCNKEYFIYNLNHFCRLMGYETKIIGYADVQKWARTGIKCICECGNEYETSLDGVLRGWKFRCNSCTSRISKYCCMVEKYFDAKGIEYVKEVRFDDCRDKCKLPFDYQVEAGLIEVDGKQHYNVNEYNFCKTKEENMERFNIQKYHDRLKDEYCRTHGIKLLRISYKDFKNGSYKNKINEFVNVK